MEKPQLPARLLVVSFLVFGLVFLSWSLLRYRRFSPDSMNYVNAARNLLRGRGLTQDTIGYGGNFLRADLPARDPLGTHPPLYPVAVAGDHGRARRCRPRLQV